MPFFSPQILKKLDRWIWPIACIFGKLLSILFRFRPLSNQTLILRPGGMGDLICAQIAIEELGIPLNSLTWLIEKRSEAWAQFAQLQYRCYDDGILNVLKDFSGRFSRVINTEQRFGMSQAFALAIVGRSGKLFCFDTNLAQGFTKNSVPYDWDQGHEIGEFYKLFSTAFSISTSSQVQLRKRSRQATGVPIVGIAGLQSPSRELSVEQWVSLIQDWSRGRSFEIAAAPQDILFALKITARFPNQAKLIEKNFSGLCNQLAQAQELFSIDGGMVHMATYFGTPATVIFTSGRDKKWAPYSENCRAIRRQDLECQPCTIFGQTPNCVSHYACKNIPTFNSEDSNETN